MVQMICEVRAASLPVIAAEIRNIRGIPAALADDVVDYALAPAVAGVLACWFDFDNLPLLALTLTPLTTSIAIPHTTALAAHETTKATTTILTARADEPPYLGFRLLGGLRIVPALRALWDDNGAVMARSFYTQFVNRWDDLLTGWNLDETFLALYKDHPLSGIVGLQFECHDNTPEYYQTVVDVIKGYFEEHNNRIKVDVYPVEDAFNVGGRLQVMPMKRDLEDAGDSGLVERQSSCAAFDLTSTFSSHIRWQPDADIYGIPMCAMPRS
ncbi:hypothetical protein ASPCAL03430 [Aspergillus calidoustus]|uniref:Uncharacterized protein n=1 Tax=Aspergillus calidoustus TaxID=454130 RepID=A0A0U5FSG2_ASPCI|nr:hypothetical protein ASPCAL03430 [Aspergillus calidoustus]